MATVFTRIMNGELPGCFVWNDELCSVFLSINPIRAGHALVVPRAEIDHWVDLDQAVVSHLMAVAQHVGRAQQAAFGTERIGVIIAGFEVPHTHVHVIPMNDMGGLDFRNAAASVPAAELAATAERIRAELRQAGHHHVAD